ncbi:ribonuclease HII [Candidatus Microgenomates bacterium]|nr:ribonuclease HII [Candidatus Microgenomates bacterium]
MRINANNSRLPNLDFESALWKQGFNFVAGVDEVGRGAWAGPLVASTVVFANERVLSQVFLQENPQGDPFLEALLPAPPAKIIIDDSKRLTSTQREEAAEWIRENCLAWGIGEIGPRLINSIGMAKASKMVFRRAVVDCNRRLGLSGASSQLAGNQVLGKLITEKLKTNNQNLKNRIDFLLIDAFYIPYVRGIRHDHQTPIIKGDQKSFSIAAASIIAKVYRDALMISLSKKFKFKKYNWAKNKGYGTKEHQNEILRNGLTGLHRVQFVESWRNRENTRNFTQNNA